MGVPPTYCYSIGPISSAAELKQYIYAQILSLISQLCEEEKMLTWQISEKKK